MNKQIKKYVSYAAVASLSLGLGACNVLDIDPTGSYGENVAYSSIKNVDLVVKDFYKEVVYANADISLGMTSMDDGATDLIKYSRYVVAEGAMNRYFYEPNFMTAESTFRSNWTAMYTAIRKINEYFYDMSNGYGNHLNADELKQRTAECRFLRAFAYQELLIRHGDGQLGVVLRVSDDHVDGPNDRAKARSTMEECWDFIIGEYDGAAADLPAAWPAADAGRITKGAALGMKARAALYAGRWQIAIDACNAVLNPETLGFTYALQPGNAYNNIFTVANNPELILPVYFQAGLNLKQHYFNNYYAPPGDGKALSLEIGAGATPSDEYASSFDIKVGETWEAFDWAKLATYTGGPWANRDPRFYASILYNGASWRGRNLQLDVRENATDGGFMAFDTTGQNDPENRSTTGYIFRKFLSSAPEMNYTSILSGQFWVEMRLPEIYFIRSEANARLSNFSNAYADLKIVRDRVGLPQLTQKSNWEGYLEDLAKERVCELGLEGHRFFDLARWGIAQKTLHGKRLHGIRITPEGSGFKYERVECDTQDRLFAARNTVLPIPRVELQNNSLCEQSSVWK
jgi:hypothetical protein